MSPERSLTDSGTKRQTKPDHPRLTEEVAAAMSTPNRFWRMMTDPGFPSPASNLVPLMVTAEAFLGLTSQSPTAPSRGIPPVVEAPPPRVAEVPPPRVAEEPPPRVPVSPTRSQNRSYNPTPTELDLDTLSTDSLREQVRRVHQRLDEVQKEVLISKDETRESSKGGSSFIPEIQSKPLPATFRLPALEPYDGSGD
ncbi:hypothetical protein B296_00052635, partial [Ensete ventricosum]